MKKLILLCVFTLVAVTNVQAGDEGIKLHGHWQFDIYNKDGSFDRKVEFENALTPNSGENVLVKLLFGANAGGWSILVNGSDLCGNTALLTGCSIVEQGNTDPSHVTFTNLTVESVGGGISIPDPALQLKGSFVSSATTTITSVKTNLKICSIIPTTLRICPNDNVGNGFTEKDLSVNPVAVQTGQTVNVTVTFSFSS